MGRFVVRRLLQAAVVMVLVTLLTFIIISASGSPIQSLQFNPRIKPADIARIQEQLGLNKPWYERYFIWAGNVLRGNLGYSLKTSRPVTTMIAEVLPQTLLLASVSTVISLAIAVPIGIYSAVRRNSLFDRIANISAVAGFAIPGVWLGLMLIIVFAVKLPEWGFPALPVGGVRDLRGDGGFRDRAEHLILPIATLVIPSVAVWVIWIRSQMLEVIRQEYIRTAQAKGLGSRTVLYRHAFRNGLIPLITLLGLSLPDLFAGTLIVENIFAYPGMGQLTFRAIGDKDHTVVMGTTLMFAFLVILGNLLADVLYAIVDPRVTLD